MKWLKLVHATTMEDYFCDFDATTQAKTIQRIAKQTKISCE